MATDPTFADMDTKRIAGNVKLGRYLGGVARTASRKYDRGSAGAWLVELRTGGLGEERREELAAKMNRAIGISETPDPVGDGFLHQRAETAGVNLLVAVAYSLHTFTNAVREAGLSVSESLDCEFIITAQAHPAEEMQCPVPSSEREQRFLRRQFALGAAAEASLNEQAIQDHGGRTFHVLGALTDLDTAGSEHARRWLAERGGAADLVSAHGELGLNMGVSRSGSGYGALSVFMMRMGPLLCDVNPTANLVLRCAPSSETELSELLGPDAAHAP